MKLFLFPALLVFVFITFCTAQAQEGAAWKVVKYDINATLPTKSVERSLSAKAVISLKNVGRNSGATVTLRINPRAEISATQVNGTIANFRKIADDKLGGLQRFNINLPNAAEQNSAINVAVSYRLPIVENNGINSISPIGSQFLPLSFWYPTPTNPYSPRGADYAPFRLSVVTSDDSVIVSSGNLVGAAFDQPLNAQPFFVTGQFDETSGAGGVKVYLPKGVPAEEKKRALDLAALADAARVYVASLLGKFPETPLRLVAVNRGGGFGDGGTILLDDAAFRRSRIDAATALTIAENIAKTWLGNNAPVRGEGYGAIQEGLARFIATQFIEKQFGKEAASIERLRQRTSYVAVTKRDDVAIALTSPTTPAYFAAVPNKGAIIWRLVAREIGAERFFEVIRSQLQTNRADGLTLAVLREALVKDGGDKTKEILNYGFDQTTDIDLLVGLPQTRLNETAVALRNTGNLPVNVDIIAVTESNEILREKADIKEKSFGEVIFKTKSKIARVEIDPEKFYPQLDYSSDIAPRDIIENDLTSSIATVFNRQDYVKAETIARKVLVMEPHFDEARTWLGRALVEQNKLNEAEKEFNAALNENLVSARTLAWSNIGLGEIALRRKQNTAATSFFSAAIDADAEYASNLIARQKRLAANSTLSNDLVESFFSAFDKAILTSKKTEVEKFILPGELIQFSNRLTGNQPEQWQTKVLRVDKLDDFRLTVEVSLSAKLLNKDLSNGTALFTLARTSEGFKLADVDLFEVR